MSLITVEPCYMPLETDATQSSPQISGMGSLADKLMLVIPTLHPVESLRFLLHHVTTSLEKQSLPFDAVVVCDESRDCSEERYPKGKRYRHRQSLSPRRRYRPLASAASSCGLICKQTSS